MDGYQVDDGEIEDHLARVIDLLWDNPRRTPPRGNRWEGEILVAGTDEPFRVVIEGRLE